MPHSQIISILEWNSTEETKQEGIEALKKDFQKSGYSQNILNDIEKKLSTERAEEQQAKKSEEAMTFPVFFFNGLNEFKKIIHDSKADLQQLIGDTKILMAVMKNPFIGNKSIRNKTLRGHSIIT